MKVTMTLADFARVSSDGKLDILGGGWSETGSNPCPSAIAITFEVPWAQTGSDHEVELMLLDDKGNVVTDPASGEPLFRVTATFQAVRPTGVLLGIPAVGNVAVNVPPLPLTPASRYTWRLTVDGQLNLDWELSFSTRPRLAAA